MQFSMSCRVGCGCGGCETTGRFGYEGFSLPATGGWCGCGDPDRPDPNQGDETPPVGVDVSFAKPVIFLEDEYENAPGETVPWQSTTTELRCTAIGGEHGGHVAFEMSEVTNLVQMSGRPLPFERDLSPGEAFCFTNVYKAVAASGRAEDIVATGHFYETDGGWYETSVDKATAVRVELWPFLTSPLNECKYRHKFGVGETINIASYPNVSFVHWVGGAGTITANGLQYICPLLAENDRLKAVGRDCEFTPHTVVVQPNGVLAMDVASRTFGVLPGRAGGIALEMSLYVLPRDVNFMGIKVEEIPDAGGTHSGYFADTYFMEEWYHGTEQGAGEWRSVYGNNFFLPDTAGLKKELPQLDDNGVVSTAGTNGWKHGTLTWNVPCGWGGLSIGECDEPVASFADAAVQIMEIDENGNCEVRKHANTVRRMIDGRMFLNGSLIP